MDRDANRLALKKEIGKATYTQTKEGLMCIDSIGRESLYPNSLIFTKNEDKYAIISKDKDGTVRVKSFSTGNTKTMNESQLNKFKN